MVLFKRSTELRLLCRQIFCMTKTKYTHLCFTPCYINANQFTFSRRRSFSRYNIVNIEIYRIHFFTICILKMFLFCFTAFFSFRFTLCSLHISGDLVVLIRLKMHAENERKGFERNKKFWKKNRIIYLFMKKCVLHFDFKRVDVRVFYFIGLGFASEFSAHRCYAFVVRFHLDEIDSVPRVTEPKNAFANH